jgi:general stress protein CsbA
MNREPLVTTSTVTAVVAALIALLASFGVNLTHDQTIAVLAVVSVTAPLVVALVARRKVTPVADPKAEDGTPLVKAA